MSSKSIDNNDCSSDVVKDSRFIKAMELFNNCEWYQAHDLFEEVWHETHGPARQILQAIIQISVAQLHLANGNNKGAILLYGEGLGRLNRGDSYSLGLDIASLCLCVKSRLSSLQNGKDASIHNVPILAFKD